MKKKIIGKDDLLTVPGAALAIYGIWLIYEPLAFIVAGVLLLITGILMGRGN